MCCQFEFLFPKWLLIWRSLWLRYPLSCHKKNNWVYSFVECFFSLRWRVSQCNFWWNHNVEKTYCTLVRSLPSVNPHVYQQLVSGVERFMISLTVSPETSKIFTFTVIDMVPLHMFYQVFLTLTYFITVNPLTLCNL